MSVLGCQLVIVFFQSDALLRKYVKTIVLTIYFAAASIRTSTKYSIFSVYFNIKIVLPQFDCSTLYKKFVDICCGCKTRRQVTPDLEIKQNALVVDVKLSLGANPCFNSG